MPKLERLPNPRMEIRWSSEKLYRLATTTPGMLLRASSIPTVCCPRWSAARSSTAVAKGTRVSGSVLRDTVTLSSGSSATRVVSTVVSAAVGCWAARKPRGAIRASRDSTTANRSIGALLK